MKALRAGADPAAGRILADTPVHENALANPILIGGEETAAITGNEFLQKRGIDVGMIG